MPALRVEAPITPHVFAWARDSAGYTVEDVAKRVGSRAEIVQKWENDQARPTFNQAKRAAEMFARPVATLFLPEPLKEKILTNFRTLPEAESKPQCPSLRYFARRVVDRCEWAAEVRRARGESPLAFVGAATLRDNPVKLAKRIREQLGVQPGKLAQAGSKEDARRLLANKIRSVGAFVFSTDYIPARAVPIEAMRGLAVSEPLAPAVAYNTGDYSAGAKIFTLAHEMVHLWLGSEGEGISADWPLGNAKDKRAQVEQFCNRVAGEVLIPQEWIQEKWPRTREGNVDKFTEKSAEKIANFLCVSPDAAAHQAAVCQLIGWDVYSRLHKKYKNNSIKRQERLRKERKEQGKELLLPRGKMLLAQSGRNFASLVLSVYYNGDIRPMEAAGLLGAQRHEHVDAIAREILE